MSKDFAEKIISSMVDENGNCTGRGISEKQFNCIVPYLVQEEEEEYIGHWSGQYRAMDFVAYNYSGNIGPYQVTIQKRLHWQIGYAVKSIKLRPAEEYQAELKYDRRMKELRDFSKSQWIGELRERLDLTLTLVNEYKYYGRGYSYYDDGLRYIYTFRDELGNCIVWKTAKTIDFYDEDSNTWISAAIGDTVKMRASVKEHNQYRDVKQTIITRPKIMSIDKVSEE